MWLFDDQEMLHLDDERYIHTSSEDYEEFDYMQNFDFLIILH
jgi:hypothetical protein